MLLALPVLAQTNSVSCLPTGQDLLPLPEAVSKDGVLRATIQTTAEQVRMTTGSFGKPPVVCYPQWIRAYRLGGLPSKTSQTELLEPLPGPVFRAQLGDLVEISFLNTIDPNKFPNSDSGCDKTSTYPGQTGPGNDPDQYPDCFALSTTTNIHFHGTHTNPDSTGDNVFLEIKPSPRSNDANRTPVVTADSVKGPFADFFTKCEAALPATNLPKHWPRFWDDLPQSLRDYETSLLDSYAPELAKRNQEMIRQGAWPQYYMGNYPYCFRLPKYTAASWPPAPLKEIISAHTHGAGSAEIDEAAQPRRPLVMGQSPGTHWYHAHKHGATTINVMNGMTGLFIIEDNSPEGYDGFIAAAYKQFSSFKQQVIVVNQLGTTPSLERGGGGGPGPHFSVNGRLQPKITMKGGEVQLWRIANNASRAGMNILAPASGGLTWKQTAQDGVQLADSNYQASLNKPMLLAAGNRIDLLVKAPKVADGASATFDLMVENTVDPSDRAPADAAAPTEPLLTVVVDGNGEDVPFMATAPPMPAYLQDIAASEVKGTKKLVFASTAPGAAPIANHPAGHTIDGKKFDGEVGAAVRLNQVEEWTLVNDTYVPNQIAHPFHIHINPFQIVEVFDPNATLSTTPGPGTVTTTSGSPKVTGTGFMKSIQVGDFIWINGENPATVLARTDTELTISNNAKGKTDATYVVAVPLYSIDKTTARAGQCVIDPANDETFKPCNANKPEHLIWWDVFSIPSGNTFTASNGTQYKIPGHFKMRSRFVDYGGYFVLHCHILAHEDRGMMTVVHVSPLQPPQSHH
jgi:FtsP/CotA-like multicopper oxidase with cupredoxin domain